VDVLSNQQLKALTNFSLLCYVVAHSSKRTGSSIDVSSPTFACKSAVDCFPFTKLSTIFLALWPHQLSLNVLKIICVIFVDVFMLAKWPKALSMHTLGFLR